MLRAAAVTTSSSNNIQQLDAYDKVAIAIGAALAIGLSTLGAGLAISSAGTAAISALAEKPETFFRSFLIVALAEALAIYGLIMGISALAQTLTLFLIESIYQLKQSFSF